MSEQAQRVENKNIPQWAQGLYYSSGITSEVLVYYDEEAIYFEHKGKESGIVRFTFEQIEGLKIIEPEPGTVITDPERDYAHKFASDASPYAHYKCTITGPNGWTQEYGVTECGEIGGFRLPYDGEYEMQVWARDYAGNLDSTPAVVNFTVDTTVP